MTSQVSPGLLTTIQAARGAAAIAVVLSHASMIIAGSTHIGYSPMAGIFRAGHLGVDFFFVLSGFIILRAHGNDIGQPSTVLPYALKRIARVYPPFWAVMVLAIGFASAGYIPEVKEYLDQLSASDLVASFLILPQHKSPLLGVSWTLQHELLFYVVFATLLTSRRFGICVLSVWFLFCAVIAAFPLNGWPWSPANLMSGFVASSYNLQFAAGMGVCVLVARGCVPAPRTLFCVGLLGFLLTAEAENLAVIDYLGQAGRLLFGCSAALVIGGLATTETAGHIRAPGLAVLLGAASYAIYLIHVPFIFMVAYTPGLTWLPGWLGMTILAAGAVLAGVLLHLTIERPFLRRLARVLGPMFERPITGGVL